MSTSGRKLGAVTGAILCLGYAFLLGLNTATLEFRTSAMEFLYVLFMHLLYAVLFFVLPSAIIGLATGWVIEVVLYRTHPQLSTKSVMALGVGICTAFAFLIHILVWLPDLLKPAFLDLRPSTSYLLYLIIPSLIYLIAGAVISRHLYINLLRQSAWPDDKPSLFGPILMLAVIVVMWGFVQFWLLV